MDVLGKGFLTEENSKGKGPQVVSVRFLLLNTEYLKLSKPKNKAVHVMRAFLLVGTLRIAKMVRDTKWQGG